jgi:hypothetical protein
MRNPIGRRGRRLEPIEFTGKPGNWVAIDSRSSRVVAEAPTLKGVNRIVARRRLKGLGFARVPRTTCALIL